MSVASERQKKEDSQSKKRERNGSRQKPLRGDTDGSSPNAKPPPRTLAQILAQVHAPREAPEHASGVPRDNVLEFYRERAWAEREFDLFQNPTDDDDSTEKSTG